MNARQAYEGRALGVKSSLFMRNNSPSLWRDRKAER
jgi:hypothetical protein